MMIMQRKEYTYILSVLGAFATITAYDSAQALQPRFNAGPATTGNADASKNFR
jgi:hypothetical protein